MFGERCLVERRDLIGLTMAGVCEIHDVVFAATDLEVMAVKIPGVQPAARQRADTAVRPSPHGVVQRQTSRSPPREEGVWGRGLLMGLHEPSMGGYGGATGR
jgi:hypothetical protein